MPWSNYLKDKVNDHLHGGPDYSRPGTTYWARFTVAPTGSGGGTEAGVRAVFANNATNWPASAGQVKRNGVVIDWGAAPSSLGTIVAVAEFDASSGGNMLMFALLTTPRVVNTGDPFKIEVANAECSYID